MGKVEIEEKVKQIIYDYFFEPDFEINNDTDFFSDLNFDSLDVTDITNKCGLEFNIYIEISEIKQIQKFADLVNLIESKLQQQLNNKEYERF